jgi:hypothetical protein
MTREEQLDAVVQEMIPLLERLRESVYNHPITGRIDEVLSRAKAIELPQEPEHHTGIIKKMLGDRRVDERDPGEHEQHVAEEMGYADK